MADVRSPAVNRPQPPSEPGVGPGAPDRSDATVPSRAPAPAPAPAPASAPAPAPTPAPDSPVAEWSTDAVAEVVVDAARHVHAALGPGLLEHVYEVVLGHELIRRGLPVERQRMFPVRYGRIVVDKGFRTDIVVDRRLLIEVKTAARLAAVHRQQVMTYCRMAGFRLGLLINFGGDTMDVGVQRIEVKPRDE